MIYQQILVAEQQIKNRLRTTQKQLDALESIKTLLSRVDNRAERIPASNAERLKTLFTDLKGKRLTEEELLMIDFVLEV
jgi:uncharacterized coiled-coil DUF342 family protein